MKDLLTDANFPRTADLRVYHLGVKPGEVANRIVTVGSPSRAHAIAAFLDATPKPFELSSERGFLTITGRYKGTPISIVSIGMGMPNMDFFVREIRESVQGDMAIVRLGSCGALVNVPVATVVVPDASVAITRNIDYDFVNPDPTSQEPAYRVSKAVKADPDLTAELHKTFNATKAELGHDLPDILTGTLNASADSFYSSQGRQTSFPDRNADLIKSLQRSTQNLATLEMETFHLFHLAACWSGRSGNSNRSSPPPLATNPVNPVIVNARDGLTTSSQAGPAPRSLPNDTVIRAAGAHMVFASRMSSEFITPEQVNAVEKWAAKAVLEALVNGEISSDRLHPDEGSVWAASSVA